MSVTDMLLIDKQRHLCNLMPGCNRYFLQEKLQIIWQRFVTLFQIPRVTGKNVSKL